MDTLTALTAVFVLGVSAQWIAYRVRLPSILLLLLTGFLAGPVFGLLDPDALLDGLLMPLVALSVAVIMFEGGLQLRLSDLDEGGRVIRNLVSAGVLVTWGVALLAARYVLDLPWPLAVLLGALLVVSGPTVVLPLLKLVRPVGIVSPILKWEGILIDPIGVLLVVLVFDAVLAGGGGSGLIVGTWALKIGGAVGVGVALGAAGAFALVWLLRHHLIPDHLETGVTLMAVLGLYAAGEQVAHESGLFAVTVMGIALANQTRVAVKHIVEFKENLTTLLLAAVFIVLAARQRLDDLRELGWESVLFLAILILVARPLAVLVSTARSGLAWNERAFLACVNPRGIVAAAVSALFAIRLADAGFEQASLITSVTFLVIVGTVIVYGLLAGPLARALGLAPPDPQGVLIAGGQPLGLAIAQALKAEGFRVMLVDRNRSSVLGARLAGLEVVHADVLDPDLPEHLDLGGIGRLLALTSNDEVNALASLHFAEVFGRAEVYQLPGPAVKRQTEADRQPSALRGRTLFAHEARFAELDEQIHAGAEVRRTRLSESFDYEAFRAHHGGRAIPLFVVADGKLRVATADGPRLAPTAGQTLVSLVPRADGDAAGPSGRQPAPAAASAGDASTDETAA